MFSLLVQMDSVPTITTAKTSSSKKQKQYTKKDVEAISGAAITESGVDEPSATSEPQVIEELPDKRTANTKTFLMSDNTCKMMIYSEPIHYKKSGKYKEIDNTLVEKTEGYYETNSSDVKVSLAENKNSEKLVTINKSDSELSWGYVSDEKDVQAKTVTPAGIVAKTVNDNPTVQIENTEKITKSVDEDTNINLVVSSGAVYEDIDNNTDFEYQINSNTVKENIIIDQPTKVSAYRFMFYTSDLIATKNKNGDINFTKKDSKKLIFQIPKGFMYDAAGTFNYDVKYELEKAEGGYLLSVIPNQDWLNASERSYPITIDPTINYNDINNPNFISVAYTNSYYKDRNYNDVSKIKIYDDDGNYRIRENFSIGNDVGMNQQDLGNNTAYIKVNQLPYINSGEKIINAQIQLDLCPSAVNTFYVKKVTSAWDPATITYNSNVSVDSEILDYCKYSTDARNFGVPCSFDITKTVKEWYDTGTRFGSNGIQISSSELEAAINAVWFSVTYRSNLGLEGYWSYQAQDIGRAGTGNVNTDTGALTLIENDITMNGNRLPISVNHVYNSNYYGMNSVYGFGNGWRLDVVQQIQATGMSDYPYVLVDGDGTRHYFKLKSGSTTEYMDEDGLEYTLTIVNQDNEHYYKIVDKAKNTIWFDVWSFMRVVTDTNNNSINYNYSPSSKGLPNYLSSITDCTGRQVTLKYDSMQYLTEIVDASGRSTKYTYDDHYEHITRITYSDGMVSTYTYGNNEMKITNCDGYSVKYTFDSRQHVSGIYETGSNGNPGTSINSINYDYNQTTFTDNKGRVVKYQFDNTGQTINIQDDEGNANMYSFYVESSTNNSMKHKISQVGKVVKPVFNVLENSSFEDTSDKQWNEEKMNFSKYPVSGSTTQDTSCGYYGNTSAKVVQRDSYNSIVYSQTQIPLQPGEKYTLSGYVKTENVVPNWTGGGAALVVKYNNYIIATSSYVTGSNDWSRYDVTFTMPNDIPNITVCGGLMDASGTAWIDGMQLEKGEVVNQYNLVENASFENYDTNMGYPFKWSRTNFDYGACDGVVTSQDGTHMYGKNGMIIYGDPSLDKHLTQAINVKGTEGDVYSLSGWAIASAIPDHDFKMTAEVIYNTGDSKKIDVNFNQNIREWQYACGIISTADTTGQHRDYKAINLTIYYSYQCNTAIFDGIQLFKDNAQSYVYDDVGNLVSAEDNAKSDSSFAYSGNNLSKMVNPDGTSYEYQYDASNRVTDAKSSEGLRYGFTYDSNGNALTSETYSDSDSTSIVPEKTYYIRNKNSGKYICYNSSQIYQYKWNLSSEKIKVSSTGDGYYKLVIDETYKVVIDATSSSGDNVALRIGIYTGSDSQKFKIISCNDGSYKIQCKKSNCLITIMDGDLNNSTLVKQKTDVDAVDQKWYFEQTEIADVGYDIAEDNAVYYIRNKNSGQYMDVYGLSDTNGARITQGYFNGGKNQQFKLVKVGEYYKIKPLHSTTGKVVNVSGASSADSAQIELYGDNGSDAQLFRLTRNADKLTYNISSKCSSNSKCLDVPNESFANGQQLIQYTNKGVDNQKWILEKVTGKITTSSTYTTDGNYMTSTTNSSGNTTKYDYGQSGSTSFYNQGLLRRVTDAKGSTVTYVHDNSDKLSSINASVGQSGFNIKYEYNNEYLSKITRNGFSYNLEQSEFGELSNVAVGTQDNMTNLVTNTYEANNGNLSKVTYGNKQKIGYTYDINGQLTEITDGIGTTKYKYFYDYKGKLAKKMILSIM